ncbi:MAG: TetR/AcrR family transcriptional regulator [Candidatus Hydrogenedentes bacterium]|nr:TetR/AcrR family transcriptional regulator [Candidatus Hydrogenedentota bacterium]
MEHVLIENPLSPRRLPKQLRSRQRVEKILAVVGDLLVEKGFEGINTNLVAEKAGIPVGSIYQFFPNKYAIFCALAELYFEELIAINRGPGREAAAHMPWEGIIDHVIDGFGAFGRRNPSFPILWSGMQHTPDLRDQITLINQKAVEANLVMIERLLPHETQAKQRLIASIMADLGERLLISSISERHAESRDVMEELKFLLKAYLRAHMSGADRSA